MNGLLSIKLIAASVSPAGDGVFNVETISSSVGNALADDPAVLADVLSELSYCLYWNEESGRLDYVNRLKATCNNRAFEVLEFLYEGVLEVPELADHLMPHRDNEAVDLLAGRMKEKLCSARAKGRSGWNDPSQCTNADLSRMLREHVEKGDPVDVANFCAFLIARGERIGPAAYAVDPLEEHLKRLVTANPEKALLAALDDNTRMWFVAELTGVASARVSLTEIEAMVSRHLMPAKGGEA
ncbi:MULTISPECIES: hypothetical protein [Agrobacterium]|uniref:hypothetical protein n=1 Tax=Agrobacterium TaxID=357 RepID=UPI0009C6EA5E|nr:MULTISPECIES: hypothetical protein [Agrobacterium]CUX57703.1 hypothetical protein AGR6A_Lc150008 [Agrobacterium sp. NCPPB 925]